MSETLSRRCFDLTQEWSIWGDIMCRLNKITSIHNERSASQPCSHFSEHHLRFSDHWLLLSMSSLCCFHQIQNQLLFFSLTRKMSLIFFYVLVWFKCELMRFINHYILYFGITIYLQLDLSKDTVYPLLCWWYLGVHAESKTPVFLNPSVPDRRVFTGEQRQTSVLSQLSFERIWCWMQSLNSGPDWSAAVRTTCPGPPSSCQTAWPAQGPAVPL